jgi:hypothetical protein
MIIHFFKTAFRGVHRPDWDRVFDRDADRMVFCSSVGAAVCVPYSDQRVGLCGGGDGGGASAGEKKPLLPMLVQWIRAEL